MAKKKLRTMKVNGVERVFDPKDWAASLNDYIAKGAGPPPPDAIAPLEETFGVKWDADSKMFSNVKP